jgi:TonB family protein
MLPTVRAAAGYLASVLVLAGRVGAADSDHLQTAALEVEGAPYLKTWMAPALDTSLKRSEISGFARVRVVVDETGHVAKARILDESDSRLAEASIAAARQWLVTPGLSGGKPAAYSMDATLYFNPGSYDRKVPTKEEAPTVSERTDCEELESTAGEYPDSLLSRDIPGKVVFKCTVTPEGKAASPQIVFASHPDFVLPSLEALTHWSFKPAMQGDLPIAAEAGGQLTYKPASTMPGEALAANGIELTGNPAIQRPPEIKILADPVIPYERALKGEGGAATVSFTIGADGGVYGAAVSSATAPDFGRALVAAVEASYFEAGYDGAQSVKVAATRHYDFPAYGAGSLDENEPVQRLLGAVRIGQVGSAQGLDRRLAPIYRTPPTYPGAALAQGKPSGRAEIEFVIDRDGRARFPRVASASAEEFGWSAATAVAQWVFLVPTRGGQPTDVRVRIPFEFKAPKGGP